MSLVYVSFCRELGLLVDAVEHAAGLARTACVVLEILHEGWLPNVAPRPCRLANLVVRLLLH